MKDTFLKQVESIPWFAKIGMPISPTSKVKQITCWNQWPGPEDESVLEIALRHQSIFDGLFGNAKDRLEAAEDLWKKIHEVVFRVASQKMPFDDKKVAWEVQPLPFGRQLGWRE